MYLESFDVFNGYDITFLSVISFLSVIAGILTVITKNPIFSVLFLIFLFGNISLYLIFVGIVFLGLSYLLVYVGAVSILFLFILMLINIRVSELIENTKNNIPLAIIVILSFFVPINSILPLFYNDIKDYTLLNVYKTKISFVSSNS
jgi:NADH-ubiquinone oxidoreductase chain 6